MTARQLSRALIAHLHAATESGLPPDEVLDTLMAALIAFAIGENIDYEHVIDIIGGNIAKYESGLAHAARITGKMQ